MESFWKPVKARKSTVKQSYWNRSKHNLPIWQQRNDDNRLTVYHGTSRENAMKLLKFGNLKANQKQSTYMSNPPLYTTPSKVVAASYGKRGGVVLKMKIPHEEYHGKLIGIGKHKIKGDLRNVYQIPVTSYIHPRHIEMLSNAELKKLAVEGDGRVKAEAVKELKARYMKDTRDESLLSKYKKELDKQERKKEYNEMHADAKKRMQFAERERLHKDLFKHTGIPRISQREVRSKYAYRYPPISPISAQDVINKSAKKLKKIFDTDRAKREKEDEYNPPISAQDVIDKPAKTLKKMYDVGKVQRDKDEYDLVSRYKKELDKQEKMKVENEITESKRLREESKERERLNKKIKIEEAENKKYMIPGKHPLPKKYEDMSAQELIDKPLKINYITTYVDVPQAKLSEKQLKKGPGKKIEVEHYGLASEKLMRPYLHKGESAEELVDKS